MRYKEFNRNAVLEKCIKLFWQNSYGSIPISKIVEATGVNRYSLYEEFDNKLGLLYASLDLYIERYFTPKLELLDKQGELPNVLLGFIMSFLQDSGHGQTGDYIIHASTELGDHDDEVKKRLNVVLEMLQEKFEENLASLDVDEDNRKLIAHQLTGFFCTSVSFNLIKDEKVSEKNITSGLDLILKKVSHATGS